MSAQKASLWLVPAEPDRAMLRSHIDRLALEYGTPSFEPHITLAAVEADHGALVAAIEGTAASHPELELVARDTAHGAERFKAVFVELADARIHELAATLCAELRAPFDAAQLQPHLSLLYRADLPPSVRTMIAAEHTFRGRSWHFDTLVASVPGGEQDDVPRWQTVVARALQPVF
jgi:hypothetical protein